MHVNPYLVIEDEKYLVDDFKFGFRQKPNAAGVPIEVPVFQGLHVVIRGHYPGFFLERWACASSQSKLVELVLKPLVLGSGPTRVFTFFDAHLVDLTKNYSEKKNPSVEMILKITAGGVRDSFSKSEYSAPWRKTFEKPCTVVAQSTTEEACVDSGEDDFADEEKRVAGATITPGWSINVHLWNSRKEMGYGILVLNDGASVEYWRTIVRAQGFSNKIGGKRDLKFSDTPTGTYHFEKWRSDGNKTIYGSNPRLDMTYEKGESHEKREEIQIHGGRQKGETNPYLWNTGGCLRVFDDAIITLKKKIEKLEVNAKKVIRKIVISNTLKFDEASKKYFIPSDFSQLNSNRGEFEKRGISHKRQYRNDKNYYTDNIGS